VDVAVTVGSGPTVGVTVGVFVGEGHGLGGFCAICVGVAWIVDVGVGKVVAGLVGAGVGTAVAVGAL
jgi:hypothetical protein